MHAPHVYVEANRQSRKQRSAVKHAVKATTASRAMANSWLALRARPVSITAVCRLAKNTAQVAAQVVDAIHLETKAICGSNSRKLASTFFSTTSIFASRRRLPSFC